jgi:hypothetical protein
MTAHSRGLTSLRFTFEPDGFEARPQGAVAWTESGQLGSLDFETGTVAQASVDPAVAFAPQTDADHVVTVTYDGNVQFRDSSLNVVEETTDNSGTFAVAIAPNVVVFSSFEGWQALRDPVTLDWSADLPSTRGVLTTLSIDDDGRRVIGLGNDRGLRVFDIASRTQIGGEVVVGLDEPHGAALRPDGLEAAVATEHGIAIWDLDPEHWVDGACELASRNLTREEWDKYIGDLAEYHATCPQFA